MFTVKQNGKVLNWLEVKSPNDFLECLRWTLPSGEYVLCHNGFELFVAYSYSYNNTIDVCFLDDNGQIVGEPIEVK